MHEQPAVARRAEELVRHDEQGGFPPQEQQPPGLTGLMDPTPDHGEGSYVGHGRLAGMRALITGGDSGIGRAVAIAYAREGADVAISYLPDEQPDADATRDLIEAAGRTAILVPGDLRTRDVCVQVVDGAVRGLGGLDV
jgi:short chain dehydrogenase